MAPLFHLVPLPVDGPDGPVGSHADSVGPLCKVLVPFFLHVTLGIELPDVVGVPAERVDVAVVIDIHRRYGSHFLGGAGPVLDQLIAHGLLGRAVSFRCGLAGKHHGDDHASCHQPD